MGYWFWYEYLDEERRMRVHRITAETEHEARKLHRQACEFRWVTDHVEPSVSSLFTKVEGTQRAIIPGHRPGDRYHTQVAPTPPPSYLAKQIANLKARTDET